MRAEERSPRTQGTLTSAPSGRSIELSKIYPGESALGRLVFFDNRSAGNGPAWTLSVSEGSPWPSAEESYVVHAVDVADVNLTASGTTAYRVLIQLDRAMTPEELEKLVYPLLLDPAQTAAVDPGNPVAYRVAVVSDLEVPHVLIQLRILLPVESAELAP